VRSSPSIRRARNIDALNPSSGSDECLRDASRQRRFRSENGILKSPSRSIFEPCHCHRQAHLTYRPYTIRLRPQLLLLAFDRLTQRFPRPSSKDETSNRPLPFWTSRDSSTDTRCRLRPRRRRMESDLLYSRDRSRFRLSTNFVGVTRYWNKPLPERTRILLLLAVDLISRTRRTKPPLRSFTSNKILCSPSPSRTRNDLARNSRPTQPNRHAQLFRIDPNCSLRIRWGGQVQGSGQAIRGGLSRSRGNRRVSMRERR